MNNFVYEYENSLYINLTNRCTNDCGFCIRRTRTGLGGYDLWLNDEPTADEIINALDQISNIEKYGEIVFCGYGEPLMKIDEAVLTATTIKEKYKGIKIRVNTNGHANIYHGENVVPRLKGLVDTMSISLNAPNAKRYQEICSSQFGEEGYEAVIDFAKECIKIIPNVILSVVDISLSPEEIKECEKIAQRLGAIFRVREYY